MNKNGRRKEGEDRVWFFATPRVLRLLVVDLKREKEEKGNENKCRGE